MEEPDSPDDDQSEVTKVFNEEGDEEEEEGSSEDDEGSDDEDDDDEDDDDDDAGEESEDDAGDNATGEDWETDEEEEGDDDVDDEEVLEASDSDDGEGERCPICLNRFREQDVGLPESCDHIFCMECIHEWAKKVNTCPVDRRVFSLILCKHSGEDKIYKKIPVEDTNKQEEEEEVDELTYCEVCHDCAREDRMLLCDGCDLGYHLDCLTPPLSDVPVEEWFCPRCATREVVDDEDDEDEEEVIPHRPRRRIPRTMALERVRSAIEEIRVQRTRNIRRILSSSEDEDGPSCSASSVPSTSPVKKSLSKTPSTPKNKIKRKYKRRKTKRKTPKKRKTKKNTSSSSKSPAIKKRKTRKTKRRRKKGRRKKRSARTAKPSPVTSVKTRIAGALGLSNPPTGRMIPMQKLKLEKTVDMKKSDIGAAQLSIFGSREELIHFDDDYGAPSSSGNAAASVTKVNKYSRLALSSNKPIGRVPAIPPVKEKPRQIVINTMPTGGALDLLGSIMQDQSKLHMDSKSITITRDGSLFSKPKEADSKPKPKRAKSETQSSSSSSAPSLFKSSFTMVDNSAASSTSILKSLSVAKETLALDEEYDPAHPTDEIDFSDAEETMETGPVCKDTEQQNEDEYDPAHPTDADELDNSDDNEEEAVSTDAEDEKVEENEVSDGDDANSCKEKGNSEGDSNDVEMSERPASETVEEYEDVSNDENEEEEGEDENQDKESENDSANSDISQTNTDNGDNDSSEEKNEDSISIGAEKQEISEISIEEEKAKDVIKNNKEQDSNVDKSGVGRMNTYATSTVKNGNSQTRVQTDSVKSDTSKDKKQDLSQKIATPITTQKDKTPEKTSNVSKDNVSIKKLSPSVKITEPGKKMAHTVKPFEISKRTLVEKRRLYGGEIDFTEDVGFSEGGFPENFEVKIKRIEEVFKDTKKPDVPNTEIKSEEKDTAKSDEKEKVVKKEEKKEEKKDKEKKGKESKIDESFKLSGKFKPISSESENNEIQKMTVSERFKMISNDTKDSPVIILDEEEDPIHEMRKLDKELGLELENPNFGKRKESDKISKSDRDRDREQKKSKRKVSIEDDELETGKYRRDSKENRKGESEHRKQAWEDIEEGEVEEEYRYREKRKKEKKKKKSDRYYDDDENIEKTADDTRIVIQVTQNTENRTVWEEDERLKRKRDKDDRRKDKEKDPKRDRKHRRHRSRSRSGERKERSKSRERKRSRSRSRDKSRRKRRERSRSRSRDRSLERSHKKKKKERERSRERDRSRERSRDRSREWSRDKSRDTEREKIRSREKSLERVDIFGRSQRREVHALKDKEIVTPPPPPPPKKTSVSKSHELDDRLAEIFPAKRQKMEEFVLPVSNTKPAKTNSHTKASKIETVSNIAVKDGYHRTSGFNDTDNKDEEYSDEPEETEQFQYTDRDEYLSQNKHTQQHTNLITLGANGTDYDPANPTESSSPAPPPLPELVAAPTPPLPLVANFTQFPPPPPGPPPPGPPPPGMLLQDHPPVPMQVSGPPPGPGILGDGPMLLQGPPPPLEAGPPPGMIQHRPSITVPMNLSVLPPGFHQGLPQTLRPQRQVVVNPFRPGMPPRMQQIPSPGVPGFGGWQVTTTTEMISSQFGSRVPSPRLHGPPMMNGPFDGLPPPQSDGPPSHNLPPGHPQFETLPPNVVQIPVEVDEPLHGAPPRQMPPPRHEPHIVHLGPHPHDPPPRLPIPLLPTSEPPPISVMVSIPPPNSSLMSMPPPTLNNMPNSITPFPRTDTPPISISSILGLSRTSTQSNSISSIPGLDMVGISTMVNSGGGRVMNNSKPEETLSQLEEISKLLSTQAKLMQASKDKAKQDSPRTINDGLGLGSNDADVFKVPLPPSGKNVSGKTDTVETVDMDMASPIDEEGNIELPLSPQFDNLIDNTDNWLEEVFSKKNNSKTNDKDSDKKSDNNNKDNSGNTEKIKEKSSTPTKVKDKDHGKKKESPRKPKEERSKRSSKENKPRHHGHHTRKQKQKLDSDKDSNDFKLKALKDAHLEMDTQEMPSSAVELTNKEKYLQKLHLQERVVEEVKMAIKPHYSAKKINKDQYKEILRKAVPKICHSKSGDINPMKIKSLVEAYIDKFNKPDKHTTDDDENKVSPGVKANGERAKPKTAR